MQAATDIHEELERRSGHTKLVTELLMANPLAWIPWTEFAHVGGALAWRSRIADSRRLLKKYRLGDVEWNQQVKASAYRYCPFEKLGRDAGTSASGQRYLFDGRSF